MGQRYRGHLLTDFGLQRLNQARQQWEQRNSRKCTQENLHERSGLDCNTISKILKRSKGVDKSSLENIFAALELTVQDEDHYVPLPETPRPIHDPNFVGRENAIADLTTLVQQGAKLIVIRAGGGVGKTTLAQHFLRTFGFDQVLKLSMAKEPQNLSSVEGVVEEWLRRYFQEEPARDFKLTLERLREKLSNVDRRIGVLIDNLEPALDRSGRFIEGHRSYVELLSVLADPGVNSVTLVTTRERLREAAITFERYRLKSLTVKAWQQFFEHRSIPIDVPFLEALHDAHGGNAKAMEILRSVVANEFNHNLKRYWQDNEHDLLVEQELADVVLSQFNRLKAQVPEAYKLLCRLGCYRYQDVATVSIEGVLCLLWDIPEQRRQRVVRALGDCSLLESEDGKYWLHPVIRQEAIDILRQQDDWQTANIAAAQFWTESVTQVLSTKDAQSALQAFYHNFQIGHYQAAAEVIIRKRQNRWGTNESLGRSFYKLGLLKPVRDAINLVKDLLPDNYQRAKLYHLLGATHWLSDDIYQAMAYCKRARRIARDCLEFGGLHSHDRRHLQLVEVNALLTLGICHMGLCNYEQALRRHSQVEQLSRAIGDERYINSVLFYIAYLNICLDNHEKAHQIANFLYEECLKLKPAELPSWVTEYRLFYLGLTYQLLGETKKSRAIYENVIYYTTTSSYGQAKAKTLYGLAGIERHEQQFGAAIKKHHESIDGLAAIGAKYDLAHAYYQLGLTWQAMERREEADLAFGHAIDFFAAVKAPKQVQRVEQAKQSAP